MASTHVNGTNGATTTNGDNPVHTGEGVFIGATSDAASMSKSEWPKVPTFESKLQEREFLKFRLAQAFRLFGHHGFNEGAAGHITVRDPIVKDAFWVNPFGLHFSLITPDKLMLVDHEGNILPESGPLRLFNLAAFSTHSKIHMARPDVLCAAHSHPLYGRAFGALGKTLDMLSQDSCIFYNDHVLYEDFNGVVLDDKEGENVTAALGSKKAVILQNHGLLTVGKSIESAAYLFMALEKNCQVQLLAEAAAAGTGIKTKKIGHEEAMSVWRNIGTETAAYFAGIGEFNLLEHREQGRYGVWNGPEPFIDPNFTHKKF